MYFDIQLIAMQMHKIIKHIQRNVSHSLQFNILIIMFKNVLLPFIVINKPNENIITINKTSCFKSS